MNPVGSLLHSLHQSGEAREVHTYVLEGFGEDFLPSTLNLSVIDQTVQASDRESFLMARRLVRDEGRYIGDSSGSAVAGSLHYAHSHNLGEDKTLVVLPPDSGSRYLTKIDILDFLAMRNT